MKPITLEKYVDQQLENWANAARDKVQSITTQNESLAGPSEVIVYDHDDAWQMEIYMLDLKICYINSYDALCERHLRGRTNEVIRYHVRINDKTPSKNIIIKVLECGEHFLGRCLMGEYRKKLDIVERNSL